MSSPPTNNMSPPRTATAPYVRAAQLSVLVSLLVLQGDTVSFSERAHAHLAAIAIRIGTRDFSGRLGHRFPHVPRLVATRAGVNRTKPRDPNRLQTAAALTPVTIRSAAVSTEAAGVAWLLLGDPEAAVEHLTLAATESSNPENWNDLAAALLEICEKRQNLQRCVDALAASDAAITNGAASAVARFNRAAALERLGLVIEARREWLASAVESEPGWAAEARSNADRLRDGRTTPISREVLEDILTRHDGESLTRLLRTDARLVRGYGESIYTCAWADAWLAHKYDVADVQLGYARFIGERLAKSYGERLLADSVAVIDEALRRGDQERLANLARAYVVYRDGRRAHSRTEAAKAVDFLREAEALFGRARSPMELIARYYRASALFVQQKTADTYTILSPLARTEPRTRGYLALEAQIGWELGLSLLLRGDYSAAIERFEHSSTLFLNLDDRETNAAIEEFRADALEFIGDPDEAWNVRRGALEASSRFSNAERQITTLATTASSCLHRREWRRAAALLGIAIDIAERAGHAVHASTCLIRRAQARVELGEIDDAKRDLADAERWQGLIADAGPAARIEADKDLVMARVMSSADPARARTLLTQSLEYYRGHGLEVFAADALLERARALRRTGNAESAHQDLLDAIASVEHQRQSVKDLQQRSMTFAAAEEIFGEAVDLALDSGRTAEAFMLAERSRGRALLDFLERAELRSSPTESEPASLGELQMALAHDAAIVEMIVLPARLVTFIVRADGLRVVAKRTTPEALARATESCVRATVQGDTAMIRDNCKAATSILIEPIENALEGISVVAFVPDRRIMGVPFAALQLRHRKLGSEIALIESPSATLAIECSLRARSRTARDILIVAASEFDHHRFPDAQPIPWLTREMDGVAAMYRNPRTLQGLQVTRSRVIRELPKYGFVHWAGHVLADPVRPARTRALIASAEESNDLTAADIAGLRLELAPTLYLSACRSGTAGRRGDGIESMALAFLVAGAPTVVGSRWDVADDDAGSIALAFHRALSGGGGPAAALREVIQQTEGNAHSPADGYTVIGGSPELVK